MSKNFDTRMMEWREQIDKCLFKIIAGSSYPAEFKSILDYAVFPGGKRLRPILFLEWHSLYAPPDESALLFACGLELMHAYSLIHDDMPCMDNDDMRRGKPSVHKEYGEGKALLAGDALLDLSYNCMFEACRDKSSSLIMFSAVRGDLGIVHGQYLDLYGKIGSLDDLINVYERKTASLIRACCVIGYTFMQKLDAKEYLAVLYGALDGDGADDDNVAALIKPLSAYKFGHNFGIAFQIFDDVSEYIAGEKSDGTTVLDYLDLDKAKALLNTYLNAALAELDGEYNGDTAYLREFAEKFVIV
ncbi:MAG: hypothetical protein HFJ21_01285 [Clostridia bacterium]|jgi:geranylgeranyl diphosphate synthase type II|nr:hypothetical protein [Clostridia bacterium]MCI9459078.1 hypothetical protein [Clostridia bacterium]